MMRSRNIGILLVVCLLVCLNIAHAADFTTGSIVGKLSGKRILSLDGTFFLRRLTMGGYDGYIDSAYVYQADMNDYDSLLVVVYDGASGGTPTTLLGNTSYARQAATGYLKLVFPSETIQVSASTSYIVGVFSHFVTGGNGTMVYCDTARGLSATVDTCWLTTSAPASLGDSPNVARRIGNGSGYQGPWVQLFGHTSYATSYTLEQTWTLLDIQNQEFTIYDTTYATGFPWISADSIRLLED